MRRAEPACPDLRMHDGEWQQHMAEPPQHQVPECSQRVGLDRQVELDAPPSRFLFDQVAQSVTRARQG